METEVQKTESDIEKRRSRLSEEEKVRFKEFFGARGIDIPKLKQELHDIAEHVHHLGFLLMCMENELRPFDKSSDEEQK